MKTIVFVQHPIELVLQNDLSRGRPVGDGLAEVSPGKGVILPADSVLVEHVSLQAQDPLADRLQVLAGEAQPGGKIDQPGELTIGRGVRA